MANNNFEGIKTWLEQAGEPVAETAFPPDNVPTLPYIVYLDHIERDGGDLKNGITKHNLTIERYSEDGKKNATLEALFDRDGIHWSRDLEWVSDDDFFEEIYVLDTALYKTEDM